MATITDIANYALGHIGERRITSIDDTANKASRTCSVHYAQARDEVLASHRWSSAKRQANLSALTDTPVFKWSYAFALPSDFIRLMEVEGQDAFDPQQWYDIQGRTLYLNETFSESDGTTVAIEYISRVADPTFFDPLLIEAISIKLAAKIAKTMSGSDSKAGELIQEYERIVAPKAKTVDAQQRNSNENSPVRRLMQTSRLIRSRRTGRS